MISDEQLIEFDKRGLIPGPEEDEATFLARVEAVELDVGPDADVLAKCQAVYGISPDWVSIRYSNKDLALWHGGGTIIDDEGVSIQLRRRMQSQDRFMGLYSKEEFLVHELAHVGRAAFFEPEYEELLAYASSGSGFRRYFGPIVRATWEVWFFLAAFLLPLLVDYITIIFDTHASFLWTGWLYLIPIGVLGLGVVRLVCAQRRFRRCVTALKAIAGDNAFQVAYRLSDREIEQFGRKTPSELHAYAQSHLSIRWRTIRARWL